FSPKRSGTAATTKPRVAANTEASWAAGGALAQLINPNTLVQKNTRMQRPKKFVPTGLLPPKKYDVKRLLTAPP
ncbi:MAG: hypothetical protein ACK528_13205, partial [Alphaproteobacteria bacterium]